MIENNDMESEPTGCGNANNGGGLSEMAAGRYSVIDRGTMNRG
jgi:hypothetical protein